MAIINTIIIIMKTKDWYVLYTASRSEKQVEERLKRLGIETFLPLHLSPRKWSDRIKLVEIPLFSSYIFVKTNDLILLSLLQIPGVSRIVYYDGSPATVREKEIEAIRSFLEQIKAHELTYSVSEEVLIACGPLKDISGKIKRIGKTQLLLHLEQLGITVSVALNQIIKKPS